MIKTSQPALHGDQHLPNGSDPIPGLLVTTSGGSYEDAVRNADLTAWWRLGDTFTFASSVADAMLDTADFDTDSPRNLDYAENTSAARPTLGVANTALGADDDGAVTFDGGTWPTNTSKFFSNTTPVRNVAQFGTTGDLAQTVTCWLNVKPSGIAFLCPVIGCWGMDGTGADNIGWVVEVEESTYVLQFRAKPVIGTTYLITGPTLTPGSWYHVTVTWDGITWTLYVNGLFVDDVAGSSAPGNPSTDPGFAVGYAFYDFGVSSKAHVFDGSVDDVAIYRRVLTPGEIAAIAGGGAVDTSNAVTSIAKEGDTQLTGDVTLSEGTNVTLTQVGQDIEIAATGGGGGGPTGAAGGVLDGTYPNPGLAAAVAGSGLAETSDVLSVNVDGSTLEISSDSLRVKDDGITSAKIAADAVGSSEIAADAVGSSEIAADAVGSSEIAAGAVGSSELADTAVTPGSYGDATHVATFTVDQDGRLTAAGSTTITGVGTSVSTDTIWDTKGDLAVASGADAAAKLPAGTDGYVLTADATQTLGLKWAAATGSSGGVSYGLVVMTARNNILP